MTKIFVYMTTNAPAQWQKCLYIWLQMRLSNDKNVCIYNYKCACAMTKMFVYMTTNAPAQCG